VLPPERSSIFSFFLYPGQLEKKKKEKKVGNKKNSGGVRVVQTQSLGVKNTSTKAHCRLISHESKLTMTRSSQFQDMKMTLFCFQRRLLFRKGIL
jgi:hypothetical protein